MCTQCTRRYFVAGSPPCQDEGEWSSTGWGKLQEVFSDIATLKNLGGGGGITVIQVKSDASIPINQASYSLQVFCVRYPVAEGRSDSSHRSGPPGPCQKSWPSRRWDTRRGQAMKGTTRLFPHAEIWYKPVSEIVICKTALFNPKQSPLETSVPFTYHYMHYSEYEIESNLF